MKELSPGAKFILYEEVAARFPHYLSSNMHSKDKVSSKVILYVYRSLSVSNLYYAHLGWHGVVMSKKTSVRNRTKYVFTIPFFPLLLIYLN